MDKNRSAILNKIKLNKPEGSPLPETIEFDGPKKDLVGRFSAMVKAVGGSCLLGESYQELNKELKGIFPDAIKIWSGDPNVMVGNMSISEGADPHGWEVLDLCIVKGQFGVAENGAIWVQELDLPERVAAFICQHLVIILEKEKIVSDMHQAYRQLKYPLPGFGVFISGPSKTADIEQSLVIGAHGPKSLIVCLI